MYMYIYITRRTCTCTKARDWWQFQAIFLGRSFIGNVRCTILLWHRENEVEEGDNIRNSRKCLQRIYAQFTRASAANHPKLGIFHEMFFVSAQRCNISRCKQADELNHGVPKKLKLPEPSWHRPWHKFSNHLLQKQTGITFHSVTNLPGRASCALRVGVRTPRDGIPCNHSKRSLKWERWMRGRCGIEMRFQRLITNAKFFLMQTWSDKHFAMSSESIKCTCYTKYAIRDGTVHLKRI